MSTSYQPILLGANVRRGGESTVDTWDDFFNNASKVFNTSTEKVIPYQAYLTTGDENSYANDSNHNIFFGEDVLGAMNYRPSGAESSPLAISDYGVQYDEYLNTPEHEYLHGIDRYFGNYKDGFGGLNSEEQYWRDYELALGDPNATFWDEPKDGEFDYWKYDQIHSTPQGIDKDGDGLDDVTGMYLSSDGTVNSWTDRTHAERAAYDPETYANDLSTSITGYGGPDGEYELKEMLNHWERFGGQQWTFDPTLADERGRGDPSAYVKSSDQRDALKAAFMNNPVNDRLGDAKEGMANVVSQALSDGRYQSGVIGNSLTLAERRELEAKGEDPYGKFNYANSNEERFARAAAMYMKQEAFGDEFNYDPETEATFRDAMNYLLEREASKGVKPYTDADGFKPDRGPVLSPTPIEPIEPTEPIWEPNPGGGF